MHAVTFGAKHVEAQAVRRALAVVAAQAAAHPRCTLVLHDAGPAGVWLFGDRAELQPVAQALAAVLGRALRWYSAHVDNGELVGRGLVLHPGGGASPIAASLDRAPATDPAEAQAWIGIRLEVEEGLDDHDAQRETLVWPWSTG